MNGQKGREADHLCLVSQAQERNSDHPMWGYPAVLTPGRALQLHDQAIFGGERL